MNEPRPNRTSLASPLGLALAGLLLPLLAACSSGESEAPSETDPSAAPRHVVLIVIDTLRADHLSCYGYWRETSPNIDALAERGVKFTRAISQSSWTAPSMVTLMTGQRLTGPRLDVPSDKPVLAELFRDAGYKTGAWVANQLLNQEMGFARGFDHFVDEAAWHSTNPPGKLDDIIAWLKDNKDRDTFTWVHFTDPHDPYSPEADLRSGQLGKISAYQQEIINGAAEAHAIPAAVAGQTALIASEVGLYDDEIRTVDRKVRRLMVAMQEAGTLENAIIALTSDHGECLWERPESLRRFELKAKNRTEETTIKHLLKQTHGDFVYQELVHVPLIVIAPQLEPGQIENAVMESVHLPSTLLRLAGIEVDGVELLVGTDMFGNDVPAGAYTMTSLGEAFVSEDGWKLILPTESGVQEFGQELQLYNLNEDSGEQRNLAAEFPGRVANLKARITERSKDALPPLDLEELRRKAEENAKALGDLGYAEGGIMDPKAGRKDAQTSEMDSNEGKQ